MLANNNNQSNSNSPVDNVDMLSISRNIDEFKSLDVFNKGYLNENQARSYLESKCPSQKSCDSLLTTAFDQTDQLGLEKFLIITHLLRLNVDRNNGPAVNNDDSTYSSRFSNLLRHCEEALKQVERDRKNSSISLPSSKIELSAAIIQLESCWKQLVQSDTGVASHNQDNDTDNLTQQLSSNHNEQHEKHLESAPKSSDSFTLTHQSIVPSGTPDEVMPGSFDFNKTEDKNNWDPAGNAASMGLPPVAPPRKAAMLSINSEGKIVTVPNDVDDKFISRDEKEPDLSKPSSTPQHEQSAKERSMSNTDTTSTKVFGESHPLFAQRTSTMDTFRSIGTDSSEFSDDDFRKGAEILKEDDDNDELSPSLADTNIVIPSAPTTVVPNRAVEDPISESSGDHPILGSSVPQHPMLQAELFSHPSFYSCNSFKSTDEDRNNDVIPSLAHDSPMQYHGFDEQSIDQGNRQRVSTFGLESNDLIKESAPQIVVPVTESPILTDDQFTSLTSMTKPRTLDDLANPLGMKGKQDSVSNDNIESEKNRISVLPLLASPAVTNLSLNESEKDQDILLENASNSSDVASGVISPPPSFQSEVKESITNNSSLGPMKSSTVDNERSIKEDTIKEPLYQSTDSNSPGVNEITDSLDKKLDLIIEDDTDVIKEKPLTDSLSSSRNGLLAPNELQKNNKRSSIVSTESRFIELGNDNINPLIKNASHHDNKLLNVSAKNKQLNTVNINNEFKEAPRVPDHNSADLPPSPNSLSSEPLSKANKRASSFFTDKSAAKAIKEAYDFLASPSKTKNGEHVLKVRKGFEGFCGLGIDCVQDDKIQA